MEYDLSKPAFAPLEEEAADSDAAANESQETEAEEPEASEEEESRVKYSRFKKYHDRALEAEKQAAYWQTVAEERGRSVQSAEQPSVSDNIPSYWRELYGDSEASQQAWKIQSEANQKLIEDARQHAIEAVRKEREESESQVQSNLEVIDEGLEQISDEIGRDLTQKEQSAILDIIDEFTPQDRNGNYLGAIIPFNKAWEIYEMRSQTAKAPKRASRDSVASLTGAENQGNPAEQSERDKNFNPLEWGAWRKRV